MKLQSEIYIKLKFVRKDILYATIVRLQASVHKKLIVWFQISTNIPSSDGDVVNYNIYLASPSLKFTVNSNLFHRAKWLMSNSSIFVRFI